MVRLFIRGWGARGRPWCCCTGLASLVTLGRRWLMRYALRIRSSCRIFAAWDFRQSLKAAMTKKRRPGISRACLDALKVEKTALRVQ